MAQELVWLDLEMTGLDPKRHRIIEIATIITDSELNIIAEGPDLVIHAHDKILERMNDYVHEMHHRSGLLDEVRESKISIEEAETKTLEFLNEHLGEKEFDKETHKKYLSHIDINNLKGLEIEYIYEWKVGESLIIDRSHIHCASTRIKHKKLGLTTFTKK